MTMAPDRNITSWNSLHISESGSSGTIVALKRNTASSTEIIVQVWEEYAEVVAQLLDVGQYHRRTEGRSYKAVIVNKIFP